MASACVNKHLPTYPNWLTPTLSITAPHQHNMNTSAGSLLPETRPPPDTHDPLHASSPACLDLIDFEFRLDHPVAMLPADQLFSDGKLVPLRLANPNPDPRCHSVVDSALLNPPSSLASSRAEFHARATESGAVAKARRLREAMDIDPLVFSPKAPRCSSRWRELLGLKRSSSHPHPELQKSASAPSKSTNPRHLRHFLHRASKSTSAASDPSVNLPLLRDLEAEMSSRFSLSSSSSSGQDHDEFPRISLDTDNKPNSHQHVPRNPPRIRVAARARHGAGTESSATALTRVGRSPMRRVPEAGSMPARGVSVDSPRMNSSGKVVFQSLERSSSSPSTFVGGSKVTKAKAMERSYSANVRVRPVLNVPVCSALRGSSMSASVFGMFLSQRKEMPPLKAQLRVRTVDRS